MSLDEAFLAQKIPLQPFYISNKLKIFTTATNYAQWKTLKNYIKRNTIVIFHDWTYQYNQPGEYWLEFIRDDLRDNFIFLSNDIETHRRRISVGIVSYLVNQNCWINEDIFNINPSSKKIYQGVINSRAKDWKRLHLAERLDNLALIINRWNIDTHRGKNDDSYLRLKYSYLNSTMFAPQSVANLYNQSRFGLILSDREGGCYTSSEYILCGLPVISTKPADDNGTGGREYWYDDYNSVICDPTPESVLEATEKLLVSPRDSYAIRASCLQAMIRQRKYFEYDVLQPLFTRYKVNERLDYSLQKEMFDGTHRVKHKILAEGSLKKIADVLKIFES